MKKSQFAAFIAATALTINKKTSLPVLEHLYLDESGNINATDLEVGFSMPSPFGAQAPALLPAFKALDAIKTLGDDVSLSIEDGKAVLSAGKRRISLKLGGDTGQFPKHHPEDIKESSYGAWLYADDIATIIEASTFVSNDSLRPAMTGVYVSGEEIAATDAYRLFFKKTDGTINSPFIMPLKAARLMEIFGGGWDIRDVSVVGTGTRHIIATNGDIKIYFRPIDARYPAYKAILKDRRETLVSVSVPVSYLADELKTAMKYAPKAKKSVVLTLNGAVSLSASCSEEETEYSTELEKAALSFQQPHDGKVRVGFDAAMALDLLSLLPKKEAVLLSFFAPTRKDIDYTTTGFYIGDNYFQMPVMLGE